MNTKFNIEILSIIYTVDQGILKVLLLKKKDEPYKGYWFFPKASLTEDKTFFEITDTILKDFFDAEEIYKEKFIPFFDKKQDNVIEIPVLCYVDEATKNYMINETDVDECEWFEAANHPKMAYNYEEILDDSLGYVKRQIKETEVLKKLYPSDFTVAELQTLVEQVTDKEIDRNSLRNKLVSSDTIEDTEQTDTASSGRPAKLYQFTEDADPTKLF